MHGKYLDLISLDIFQNSKFESMSQIERGVYNIQIYREYKIYLHMI